MVKLVRAFFGCLIFAGVAFGEVEGPPDLIDAEQDASGQI